MQDIAMSVGATYFSEKTGDDLSLIQTSDLGVADKVIVGEHSSVIFKKDNSTPELNDRIAELKIQKKNTKDKASNEFIKERIASLAGSIGCIYVGGNSEMEQKEKYDRVDDSVCAVRSALEEGILAGGGIALFRESMMLAAKTKNQDEKDAVLILESALRSPLIQILDNAGKDRDKVIEQLYDKKYNYGYDVKNNKYGDMYKLGVIDPLKVTKNALTNAISVATTILSTNAIVTNMRA
jgi:chaperonin GroEL